MKPITIQIADKLDGVLARTFGYKALLTDEQGNESANPQSLHEYISEHITNFIFSEMKTNIQVVEEEKVQDIVSGIISKQDIQSTEEKNI